MEYYIGYIKVSKKFYKKVELKNDSQFALFLLLRKLAIKSVEEHLSDPGNFLISEKMFKKVVEINQQSSRL